VQKKVYMLVRKKMENDTDKEQQLILKEENMKVNGKLVNDMVKEQ